MFGIGFLRVQQDRRRSPRHPSVRDGRRHSLARCYFLRASPRVAGYALPGAEEQPAAAAGAAPAAAEPLPVLLAKADPAKGQARPRSAPPATPSKRAAPNKIGPDLYGVVNRPMGSHEGFKYSAALQERAAKGDKWTFESLDAFIANPEGLRARHRSWALPA